MSTLQNGIDDPFRPASPDDPSWNSDAVPAPPPIQQQEIPDDEIFPPAPRNDAGAAPPAKKEDKKKKAESGAGQNPVAPFLMTRNGDKPWQELVKDFFHGLSHLLDTLFSIGDPEKFQMKMELYGYAGPKPLRDYQQREPWDNGPAARGETTKPAAPPLSETFYREANRGSSPAPAADLDSSPARQAFSDAALGAALPKPGETREAAPVQTPAPVLKAGAP